MEQSVPTMTFRNFLESAFEMAKPRISALLVTVALGSFVICGGFQSGGRGWLGFIQVLVSVSFLGSGIFILNHWMEKDLDRLMVRTRDRPLASGQFPPALALTLGLSLTLGALAYSTFAVGWVMGAVALFTALGYLLVYTPLKYHTPLHTALGALPGATPPLAGALAATGDFSPTAWLLTAVLFFWQFPHFLSIEMIYRDDYAKAGVQVLPVSDPGGFWTGFQVTGAIVALGVLSFVLFPQPAFLAAAGILNLVFLFGGLGAVLSKTKKAAKTLLRVSIFYFPLFFLLLITQNLVQEALHG